MVTSQGRKLTNFRLKVTGTSDTSQDQNTTTPEEKTNKNKTKKKKNTSNFLLLGNQGSQNHECNVNIQFLPR